MLELAGFAAGVCGILFLLQSGQGLSYPVLLIDLAVAAFCIFLWWIHCFSVRAGFWFDWIFGASWLLILFLFQDTLLPGMVQLMAVFLIFVLEFRWRSHGFLYLFTTLLLLAGPLVQIQPGAGSVILLLFFQIFFLSIQGRKWKKRRVTESKGTGRAETHLRITALAFIAVAFTLAAAFVLIGEEQYLKGFEGGEYENGQWMPAGEEDVLEQTSQILGWGDWRGTVGTMLDSMYFFMNSSTNPEASEEGRNLTVRYLTRDYSVYYNPYYSVWNRGYFGKSAYRYRYYEQQEMNINWQSASREMGEYARWQRQLQNAYQKAIQKEYTKVDREALPKLSRLCRQQEGSGQEADCRRCFSKLITAVHAAGVLREYSGQEIDFAERLVQAVQGLSREESRKLVGIVNQAAFGAEPPSEEDEAFVKQAYRKIVQRIYRNLSWYRKLQFRLFYVFL